MSNQSSGMLIRFVLRAFMMSGLVLIGFAASVAGGFGGVEPAQQTTQESMEASPVSFTDRSARGRGSSIGFAVGFNRSYLSDPQILSAERTSDWITSVSPRLFGGAKTSRNELFWDYRFSYNKVTSIDQFTSTHAAMLSFRRRLSPRLSLQLTDTFNSGFNDLGANGLMAPLPSQSSYDQDLDVTRQRVTQNSLVANLGYQLGSRSNLGAFVGHQFRRYNTTTTGDNQGVHVGVQHDLRINKWLFLRNSYSSFLNKLEGANRNGTIHRLEAGGLKLELRRNVELSLGGGLEAAKQEEKLLTTGGVQAGITRTSRSSVMYLGYHRGLTTAGGSGLALTGHNATAWLTQWLTRRMNFSLNTQYTRGSSDIADLEYISGNASLGVAVQRHVVFSTSYWYVSQRLSGLTFGTPRVSRYTVSAGLEFYLPSITER